MAKARDAKLPGYETFASYASGAAGYWHHASFRIASPFIHVIDSKGDNMIHLIFSQALDRISRPKAFRAMLNKSTADGYQTL